MRGAFLFISKLREIALEDYLQKAETGEGQGGSLIALCENYF